VDADEPVPLPNLDFKFVCANTLIPLEGDTLFTNKDAIKRLHCIKEQYFQTSDYDEKQKLQADFNEIKSELLWITNRKFRSEFRSLKAFNQYIAELGKQASDSKNKQFYDRNPFDANKSNTWFDSQMMFGVDGFDIVIGNPPYLGEKWHKDIFQPIAQSPLWKKFYQGKMDLFYFFFHIGLDCLKEKWIMAYITTNYFITATWWLKLRNDMRERSDILRLINFWELKIFESALGQHNMITMLAKWKHNKLCETIVTKRKGYLWEDIINTILSKQDSETQYYAMHQWNLYDSWNIKLSVWWLDDILDKIAWYWTTLWAITNVTCGIHAGADVVSKNIISQFPSGDYDEGDWIFVLNDEEIKEIFWWEQLPFIKKRYKASNIDKFYINYNTDKYILYSSPHNEIKSENFIIHISKYKKILENIRKVNNENLNSWKYLRRGIKDETVYTSEKIITPYRTKKTKFAYNQDSFYSSLDVYYIVHPQDNYTLKFLLGVLNSHLIYVWLYNRGKRKWDMLELYQEPLSKIPIPKITSDNKEKIIRIQSFVDQILSIKKTNPKADTSDLERKIDILVYKLYELTLEDSQIIDPTLTQEEWDRVNFE